MVAAIDLPVIHDSQIIVFFSQEYFSGFFDRTSGEQVWEPLPAVRTIATEWELSIPQHFSIRGYSEHIKDEDYESTGEVWFVGELHGQPTTAST